MLKEEVKANPKQIVVQEPVQAAVANKDDSKKEMANQLEELRKQQDSTLSELKSKVEADKADEAKKVETLMSSMEEGLKKEMITLAE